MHLRVYSSDCLSSYIVAWCALGICVLGCIRQLWYALNTMLFNRYDLFQDRSYVVTLNGFDSIILRAYLLMKMSLKALMQGISISFMTDLILLIMSHMIKEVLVLPLCQV